MIGLKRGLFVVAGLMVLLLISGFGSISSTHAGSTHADLAQSMPSTISGVPSTTPVAKGVIVVKTASLTVHSKVVTALVNLKGLTLYYFKSDTASHTVCTGSCVGIWPALLFTGSGNPSSSTALPGHLAVFHNTNGTQVIYNGHPLYTYSKDTAPGQANGDGIQGKWFVATPTIANNAP
jgi:predicted lipoprotein with Yx(FWY)xxD motif